MEKIKIIDPLVETIHGGFGITEQRLQEIVSHIQISYNSWKKQIGVNRAILLQKCCEICKNINETAYTSFHLGQVVCKINYAEKKVLNDPWNDNFFEILDIAIGRSVVLNDNLLKEAKKWGNSESSSYTILLRNCCIICETVSENSCVAFMLGFLKYKLEILAGEV